jgi:F-type H+-transporting ATPase subunit gamma
LVQIVLEARASEQSARMVSMKTATENANGLIGELTLDYNKARQAQITNELMEISTAMAAME